MRLSLALALDFLLSLSLFHSFLRLIDSKASYKCFMDEMSFYFCQRAVDRKRVKWKIIAFTMTTSVYN